MLEDIRRNPLFLTDVYNLSHTDLKEDVSFEVSHIYNRSRPMILYGFNEIVINLLNTKIEVDMVAEAEEYAKKMGMIFPTQVWYDVVEKEKGWIPLRVQALKDGTWVPKGTPFAQVMNTVEGYGELVAWWEALYLHSYFASACATEAFFLRKYLEDFSIYNRNMDTTILPSLETPHTSDTFFDHLNIFHLLQALLLYI